MASSKKRATSIGKKASATTKKATTRGASAARKAKPAARAVKASPKAKPAAGKQPKRRADVPNDAAREGRLSEVRKYLAQGYDIDAQGSMDETLLFSAVDGGQWKVFLALLEAEASIHTVNYREETPLHRAAGHGLARFVRELLDRGADANAVTPAGKCPLHMAGRCGRLGIKGEYPEGLPRPEKAKVIQMLLEAGADVNAEELAGRRPLWFAEHSKNGEGVQELKEAGGIE